VTIKARKRGSEAKRSKGKTEQSGGEKEAKGVGQRPTWQAPDYPNFTWALIADVPGQKKMLRASEAQNESSLLLSPISVHPSSSLGST